MKYLIGLLVAIVVIIFIIIKLLTGGSNGPATVTPADLLSYAATSTEMRYTIENPVQAASTHREIEITVGRDETVFTLYRGYDQQVMTSKRYSTGQATYATFLRALDRTGRYTAGDTNPKLRDGRGYCALGDQYTYEIVDGAGNVKQQFWSTTCGDKTFHGDVNAVNRLFQAQVPDYDDLTGDVEL